MNSVEPIRDIELVRDIADYLKDRNERDYIMFLAGIYSGLRISDILNLRVRDVRGRDRIVMREKKTGKERKFAINDYLKKKLAGYIRDKKDYEYLFASRQGGNRPISRQQAYNIMSGAGRKFGLESIGTHTLRKTFGYHMYRQTKDIVTIQKILNHSSPDITLRYIGVTQDTMDSAVSGLSFGLR